MDDKEFSTLKKWFCIGISLILSLALWLFISYDTNPEMTKVFNSVPINYGFNSDENIPKFEFPDKLIVVGEYKKNMSVTLSGRRNQLISLKPEDIVLSVDSSKIKKGLHDYKINASLPFTSVSVSHLEFNSVSLETDDYLEKEFKIEIEELGSLEGNEYLDYTMAEDYVLIGGSSSEMRKIKRVVAVVNVQSIKHGENKKYSLELVPNNPEDGQINADLSFSEVDIKTDIKARKTVDLVYSISEKPSNDNIIIYEMPSKKSVDIYGDSSIINDIKSIACKPVDLKNITEPGKYNVRLEILKPIGVNIKEEKPITLNLEVDKNIKKSYSFKNESLNYNNLIINNLSNSFDFEIQDNNFAIELSGFSQKIDKFKSSDIKIEIDAKLLEAGQYRIKYNLSGIDESIKIEKRPAYIEIMIYEKTQ